MNKIKEKIIELRMEEKGIETHEDYLTKLKEDDICRVKLSIERRLKEMYVPTDEEIEREIQKEIDGIPKKVIEVVAES